MHAIRIHINGGPEVMRYEEVDIPSPEKGEVLVKLKAIGVNFIDVYHRTGLYPLDLPAGLGLEGAGTVEETGAEVTDFRRGDRVAYVATPGSYAEYALVPAGRLIKLPEGLSFIQGAAAMLQGMTAHYLSESTYPLKPGDTALIHAAAGGVGLLLVQMAKQRGAKVFATVSNQEKAQLARDAGADVVILYTEKDFEEEIKTLVKGVNVVYDSVGKTTFEKSLNCLLPRGYMVSFGQSSGKVESFNPGLLAEKGSLFLTRPILFHHIASRESLEKRANDVLGWIASSQLKLRLNHTFKLSEAAQAHRSLEGRKTTGKVLLIP